MGLHDSGRPEISFLNKHLIKRVIEEAIEILARVGVWVEEEEGLNFLGDAGADVDLGKKMAFIPKKLVENALATVPPSFKLYDRNGKIKAEFGRDRLLYSTPLSGAIKVWDYEAGKLRDATHKDCLDFIKVNDVLDNVLLQTGGFIPADIPPEVATCYRDFLCLRFSVKPLRVSVESKPDKIKTMIELMEAIRGNDQELREKPMCLFTVASTSPLKWEAHKYHAISQLAKKGIPLHICMAPMLGSTAPVTILGGVTQVVAEFLSGMVMHQLTNPGAPIVFNTTTLGLDMRFGNITFAAIEANMGKVACAEIARYLNIPNSCHAAVSDAKRPDSQSGFESAHGIILGALGHVDLVMGIGAVGAGEANSLEKVIIDNELFKIANRLRQGITQRGGRLAEDLFGEGRVDSDHFLQSPYTLKWFKDEYFYPSNVISREDVGAWQFNGSTTAEHRAKEEVQRIIAEHEFELPDTSVDKEMTNIVRSFFRKNGIDTLPAFKR